MDIQGSRVGSVKINILRFLYHTVCGCVLIQHNERSYFWICLVSLYINAKMLGVGIMLRVKARPTNICSWSARPPSLGNASTQKIDIFRLLLLVEELWKTWQILNMVQRWISRPFSDVQMQNNYLFESPWWPRAFLEMALKYIHEVHFWTRNSGRNGNWTFFAICENRNMSFARFAMSSCSVD